MFFFKQKTAYELLRSLVGSVRCIRDRDEGDEVLLNVATEASPDAPGIVVDPGPGMVMPGV